MSAIYIMTLLVLMGTDILPSKSHAVSETIDDIYCKTALPYQLTVEAKINYYNAKTQPLPTCKCGPSGSISKIDILDSISGKTTSLVTCSGCTGPQIPVKSDLECCNIADIFRPDLDTFCRIVRLRCKNYTVYRCGSPVVGSTQALTTTLSSTTTITNAPTTGTSTPLQTTISVPSTVTAKPISIKNTPILDDPYI